MYHKVSSFKEYVWNSTNHDFLCKLFFKYQADNFVNENLLMATKLKYACSHIKRKRATWKLRLLISIGVYIKL
jgi:hypothetical protein